MVEISCWSKLVVPKKHFYLYFAVFNNRKEFFLEPRVLYLTRVVAMIYSSVDTVFILEEELQG